MHCIHTWPNNCIHYSSKKKSNNKDRLDTHSIKCVVCPHTDTHTHTDHRSHKRARACAHVFCSSTKMRKIQIQIQIVRTYFCNRNMLT